MSRQTRRRRVPKAEPAPVLAAEPRALTEVERDRLRQRFARMKGRAVVLGFESIGAVVEAKTPEELNSRANAILIEATKRQRPS